MKTNKTMVMAAIMVATFLTAIEGTIISTAMPKIVSDLQGFELMNWVFSIYLLTSAVTVPIFGKLSDLYGRKKIFVYGTLLFLIGSTLCGFAMNMEQLIFYRFLQGIGAGAVMPITTTLIADIYPFEKRARMMGFVGFVWGAAGIIGPLVGGFFVDHITWHWIFFMNIPFGLIAILLIILFLKENITKTRKPIDYWGALTFTGAMLALLYGVQKGSEEQSWLTPTVLGLFIVFILLIALFAWIESKVQDPIIPLTIFRTRTILAGNLLSMLVHAVLIGLIVYIPMWVQGVLGYGATTSGFMLAPMSITWTIGSFICGRLLLSKGVRLISLLGTTFLLLSTLWLTLIQVSSGQLHFYLISALIGIGFGITVTLYMVIVQSAVIPAMRGVATASNVFFRTVGQTIGIAFFGTYFNMASARYFNQMPPQETDIQLTQLNELINPAAAAQLPETTQIVLREVLVSGVHEIFIILAVLAGICLLLTALLPKVAKREQDQQAN